MGACQRLCRQCPWAPSESSRQPHCQRGACRPRRTARWLRYRAGACSSNGQGPQNEVVLDITRSVVEKHHLHLAGHRHGDGIGPGACVAGRRAQNGARGAVDCAHLAGRRVAGSIGHDAAHDPPVFALGQRAISAVDFVAADGVGGDIPACRDVVKAKHRAKINAHTDCTKVCHGQPQVSLISSAMRPRAPAADTSTSKNSLPASAPLPWKVSPGLAGKVCVGHHAPGTTPRVTVLIFSCTKTGAMPMPPVTASGYPPPPAPMVVLALFFTWSECFPIVTEVPSWV